MPTYEYKCDACGHKFERFHSITAAPIKRCPECGKAKVKRLIGPGAGMIFKGSGFYITDYRDKSYTDKAKAESGATATPTTDAKPAETKTGETKPAESKPAESKPSEPKPVASKSAAKAASKPAKKSGR